MAELVANLHDLPIVLFPPLDLDLHQVDISPDDAVPNGGFKENVTSVRGPSQPFPQPPSFTLDTLRITRSTGAEKEALNYPQKHDTSPHTPSLTVDDSLADNPQSAPTASPKPLKRKADEDNSPVDRRLSPSHCSQSECSACFHEDITDLEEDVSSIVMGETKVSVVEATNPPPAPKIQVQVKGSIVVAVSSSQIIDQTVSCTRHSAEYPPMRSITFDWPQPGLGAIQATRSLAYLQALSNPFEGPLCPCQLRRRQASGGGSRILSQDNWEAHGEHYPQALTDPIILGPFLMQGRIWSGFSATVARTGQSLVAKFTSTTIAGSWVCDEAHREAWIYHRLLPSLWGSVVPTWHGVHVGYQPHKRHIHLLAETLVAVLENAGEAMTEEEVLSLSNEDKAIVVGKYRALHAAGVLHKSAKYKHWMRHTGAPITSLRLIDFGSSVVRQSDESLKAGLSKGKPVVFEVEAANEIRKVCGMLGYAIKKT